MCSTFVARRYSINDKSVRRSIRLGFHRADWLGVHHFIVTRHKTKHSKCCCQHKGLSHVCKKLVIPVMIFCEYHFEFARQFILTFITRSFNFPIIDDILFLFCCHAAPAFDINSWWANGGFEASQPALSLIARRCGLWQNAEGCFTHEMFIDFPGLLAAHERQSISSRCLLNHHAQVSVLMSRRISNHFNGLGQFAVVGMNNSSRNSK
jgi:hypothetical protein